MRSEVLRGARLAVDKPDVGVVGGPALDERDEALVTRDGSEIEAAGVPEEQRAGIAIGGVLVQVEVALIALVRRDEERPVILGPAGESRVQLE